MTKDMLRRIGRMEADQGAELPPELRQWFGKTITEAEQVVIDRRKAEDPRERRGEPEATPARLMKWFENRGVTQCP